MPPLTRPATALPGRRPVARGSSRWAGPFPPESWGAHPSPHGTLAHTASPVSSAHPSSPGPAARGPAGCHLPHPASPRASVPRSHSHLGGEARLSRGWPAASAATIPRSPAGPLQHSHRGPAGWKRSPDMQRCSAQSTPPREATLTQ